MSKRYIPQTPNNDFVYPNNDKVEYDIEIAHNINNNVVSGTIDNLTIDYNFPANPTQIVLQYDYVWNRNGAEVFLNNTGAVQLLSVHLLPPNQEFFKPWRMVDDAVSPLITIFDPTYSGTVSKILSPSNFGLASWPDGDYSFEFRFVGLKENYIVCESATLLPVPTPTPTPTTFSCVCKSYTATNNSLEATAEVEWTSCEDGLTISNIIAPGTGISLCACEGSVSVRSGSATIDLVGDCSPVTPTPTPTATLTATPTPTPTATLPGCIEYFLTHPTFSGESLIVDYLDCNGDPQQYVLYWSNGNNVYLCAIDGSVVVVDYGIDGSVTRTENYCS